MRKVHWRDHLGKIRCGEKRNVRFLHPHSGGDYSLVTCLKCRHLLRKDLIKASIDMYKFGLWLNDYVKYLRVITEEELHV